MPQDIHLDSFAPCWLFQTVQEHSQKLLMTWNGYKVVKRISSISDDRTAAACCVRAEMQHAGHTWPDNEWAETVEPRIWHWLCSQVVQKELGAVPLLDVKRVPIPKGWTIVVDSSTPHNSAPAVSEFGP